MFRSMFEDDPFFRDPMIDMHRMMGIPTMEPQGSRYASGGRRHTEPNNMALSPFGMMGMGGSLMGGGLFGRSMFGGDLFGQMQSMMDMNQSMLMSQSRGGGMPGSFQSSYTSISYGDGDGQPKVYQATSSTRLGPGGVKETQKTERDSTTGLQKMAIGHHIDDRSHIIEKSMNSKTGDKEESQEFINLEEEEAGEFDREFKRRIRSAPANQRSVAYHPVERHSPYRNPRHEPAAIEYHLQPGSSRHHTSSRPHRHHRHRDGY